MNKLQKICLLLTIFCVVHYTLYILLDFTLLYTYIHAQPWIEKLYAFVFGVCAFVNILLFKKD